MVPRKFVGSRGHVEARISASKLDRAEDELQQEVRQVKELRGLGHLVGLAARSRLTRLASQRSEVADS